MRRAGDSDMFLNLILLRGPGDISYESYCSPSDGFEVVLTTEDPRFATDPEPPTIEHTRVRFQRPGAVVLRRTGQCGT
jgi:hypothetical protein